MFFSQTAEYALRAVVWLADHGDRARTTAEVADATKVPAGYLSKVLQSLGRAGIVEGQRGVGGGFQLARPAAQMTVLQVVNAVDPIRRITSCPLGLEAHGRTLCPLHHTLDEAVAAVERGFSDTTIADLLQPTANADALCQVRVKPPRPKRK